VTHMPVSDTYTPGTWKPTGQLRTVLARMARLWRQSEDDGAQETVEMYWEVLLPAPNISKFVRPYFAQTSHSDRTCFNIIDIGTSSGYLNVEGPLGR
jgi:hypothetical protein